MDNYYIMALCNDSGQSFSCGPFTWDQAMRRADAIVEAGEMTVTEIIDASTVWTWAVEVLVNG